MRPVKLIAPVRLTLNIIMLLCSLLAKGQVASPCYPHHFIQPDLFGVKDSFIQQLLSIGNDDQRYREEMANTAEKYGGTSPEIKALLSSMRKADSINTTKVTSIIDQYGWLGADVIGPEANTAIFMVIQHADLPIQLKYLPIMRAAVKDGRAKPASLALLEDRVALKQGRKQTYGSQISWNMATNEYYVLPLEDPDNVDVRRTAIGLQPLSEYINECCQIKWDAAQYKKDLPGYEAAMYAK